MNLPTDTRFDYIVSHEAWYADSVRATNGGRPELNIRAADPEGGCAWEFMVQEHDFGSGRTAVRLMMFGDAFDAFVQIPEFFEAMCEQGPKTLDAVRRILDKLGAVDSTERRNPYAKIESDIDAAELEVRKAIDRLDSAGAWTVAARLRKELAASPVGPTC